MNSKKIWAKITILLIAFSACFFCGCSMHSKSPFISIVITPTNATIAPSGTQQYTATLFYNNNEVGDITNVVTWNSSNTSFATINSRGLATGVVAGTTIITATFIFFTTSNKATLTVGAASNPNFAAGYYVNASGGQFPMLAISADGGTTWTYQITSANMPSDQITPSSSQNSQLIPGDCSGALCMAAGYYINSSPGGQFPMVAMSTDGGNTWNYTLTSTTIPSDYLATSDQQNSELFPGGCNGNLCMAAGYYVNLINGSPGGQFPMVAISSDSGNSWTYTLTSQNMPNNYLNSQLQISELYPGGCNGTTCFATGFYESTSRKYYPMLAVSADGGSTWTYAVDSVSTLPSDFKPSSIHTTNLYPGGCNGTVCIAAGYYENTQDVFFPMLLRSTDSGSTWTYKITSSNPPPNTLVSSVHAVSRTIIREPSILYPGGCNGTVCIAAGTYTTDNGQFPLVAIGSDNGASWSYTLTSTTMPTDAATTDQSSGLFPGSCNGNVCFAAGSYKSNSSTYAGGNLPMLAVSTDGGTSWTYAITSSSLTGGALNMPFDAATGNNQRAFLAPAGCNGSTCTAVGYYTQNITGSKFPLIAVSTDSGVTWSYQSYSNNMPSDQAAAANQDAQFCTLFSCILSGRVAQEPSIFLNLR